MVCQECGKKPANLHFAKIVNGNKTEFHICEACARDKSELIPGTANGFSIHNLLSGFMSFDHASAGAQTQPLHCEECGLTFAQFRKVGRFGCSLCYRHFGDQLEPLLKRVHGGTVHVGKIPHRSGRKLKSMREIDLLKTKMKYKIEQEEFEQAAHIRDEIRKLEKELEAGNGS